MPLIPLTSSLLSWRRVVAWASQLAILSAIAGCGDSPSGRPTGPERIPVAAIRIAPVDEALLVGDEHPLQASPLSASGAVLDDRPLTWTSENEAVATVSAAGVVTARAAGTAGIGASSEGKTARIEVRIVAPNPLPVLTALSPAVIPAGSTGPIDVDVTGTGFTAATRLRVNGIETATQHLDATTLRLQLGTAALENAAQLAVTAATPAPGGGVSNALDLTIEPAAAPTITALDPRQITAGWAGAFPLTVSGSGFTPRSVVSWDGAPRSTRYVNATTLHITIDPADVRVARTVPVLVETPAPGGGSAATTFAVNAVPVARVTVHSPRGFAWTWLKHAVQLSAVAEDHLGRELTDRHALWNVANSSIATTVPVSDREVAVYGVAAGETDVEAAVDGVRAQRTVRVHETPNFDLVYESGAGDERHLMLWDLSMGAAPRRLRTTVAAFSPSPSPDGREIAFAGVEKGAGVGGNIDLFITLRDGTVRRVAPSPAFDGDPAWSPDGTKLAFTSTRATGLLDIFVVELATGALTRLTSATLTGQSAGSGFAARSPAWSPDGTQIAYTVQGATGSELWLMSTDGTGKLLLTDGDAGNNYEPTWAPDGSVIAFSREFRQPQQSLLMTVNRDGSNLTAIGGRLVSVSATPAYTPDGRWLTTAEERGNEIGAVYAFSIAANAGPRVVMPVTLGGGRHARWMRRP